ncbi:MAG: YceI family protein [Candidatus Marinimicrobia bacterium]|nr:YceI family protein [Candidatus Neomarinimicrobiota bacterium]
MRAKQLKIRLAAMVMILKIALPEISGAQLEVNENGNSAPVDITQWFTFRIIPEESEIRFYVAVPIAPDFSGRVERFQGTIAGFPTNLEKNAYVEIVIDVESMETGFRPRDRDMHRALEAETYPKIRFSMDPGNLEHLGKRPVQIRIETPYRSKVIGTLELRGVEREITMEVEWELSEGRIRVLGETSLLLSDYGIERPRAPFLPVRVNDQIRISFSVTGKLTKD